MELFVVGVAAAVAWAGFGYLWARRAFRDGYMEGLRDSKRAFDLMLAKGEIIPGAAAYEELEHPGDFGDLPKKQPSSKMN